MNIRCTNPAVRRVGRKLDDGTRISVEFNSAGSARVTKPVGKLLMKLLPGVIISEEEDGDADDS